MEAANINWEDYMDPLDEGAGAENSEEPTLVDDHELESDARNLMERCNQYYQELSQARKNRADSRNFYVGDQLSRKVTDPDTGETITEYEHIQRQGQVPLKQNEIRKVVKNLLGQFRENDNQSIAISRKREDQKVGEMLTNALHYSLQLNEAKELDVRQFEELLVSGFAGWKGSYKWHKEHNRNDIEITCPHFARLFFNTGLTDIRLKKEIHTIGQILDMELNDMFSAFAKNGADIEKIKEWYGRRGDRDGYTLWADEQGKRNIDNLDFYLTDDTSKCRVIEIWTQRNEEVLIVHDHATGEDYETSVDEIDSLEQENMMRIKGGLNFGVPQQNIPLIDYETKYENVWYYYYLTPQGKVLQHDKTPYEHGSHPYSIMLYPLIDGEIFGLVHDIKDQQVNINQMMTLLRFIISSGAKGVMMFPEEAIPDGYTKQDIADETVAYNGIIFYKNSKAGQDKPSWLTSNSQNAGAMDMLNMQFKLLEGISGVNSAIQGQAAKSGTPSSRYAQESNNASLNNRDFFDFFFSMRKERDRKIIKLIQQYYNEERYINVAGQDVAEEAAYYDPDVAKDADVDVIVGQTTSSTAYNLMLDDTLLEFLREGHIDFGMFLDNTRMPFKDQLRESYNKRMIELQNKGAQENPQAMQMFDQAMNGRAQA